MHIWTKATCAACKRTIKCRSVSLIRPPFAAFCGPCARAAEAIPYPERTLAAMRDPSAARLIASTMKGS